MRAYGADGWHRIDGPFDLSDARELGFERLGSRNLSLSQERPPSPLFEGSAAIWWLWLSLIGGKTDPQAPHGVTRLIRREERHRNGNQVC